MPTNELHLQTLTDLERELRRRYGRQAEALISQLPLDYAKRVASLRRLLGNDPTDLGSARDA